MELNGLPVHPLIVHLAVVMIPVAAVLAALYSVVRWRWALRWPMVGTSFAAPGSVVLAWYSGKDLLERKQELEQLIQTNHERASSEECLVGQDDVRTWRSWWRTD